MLLFLGPFWLFYVQPNGKFYGHLVHFVVIWYIFPRFGMLYRDKPGNPVTMYIGSQKHNFLFGEKLSNPRPLWHCSVASRPP
jgi:hypothetical protein